MVNVRCNKADMNLAAIEIGGGLFVIDSKGINNEIPYLSISNRVYDILNVAMAAQPVHCKCARIPELKPNEEK